MFRTSALFFHFFLRSLLSVGSSRRWDWELNLDFSVCESNEVIKDHHWKELCPKGTSQPLKQGTI